MDWDLQKLDLLHQLSLAMGPKKVDKEFIRSCLVILTILSDQDTGTEIRRLLERI